MNWEQMPYFLAAARLGTLRAAAEDLGATHATVRRHVETLENSYGVQLFRRTRQGLQLTDAGRSLVPVAEQTENLLRAAKQRLQGLDREASGTVRLSLTGTMAYEIVAPILVEFAEWHPEIDLEIRVTDRLEDINRLETDVSLRYATEISDDVVARKLFPMTLTVLASRDYVDREFSKSGPGGKGLFWIGWDTIDRRPEWLAHSPFPNAEARFATTDHIMQLSMARRGFGMVKTSRYFASVYPELVQVPGAPMMQDRCLWILLHSDLRKTTRVRNFVDFLCEGLLKMKPQLFEAS